MEKKTVTKKLSYIGACIDEGQNIIGVEQAPNGMRKAGLFSSLQKKFKVTVKDYGNVDKTMLKKEQLKQVEHKVKNLHILDPLLQMVNNKVKTALSQNPQSIILTIGGDHSIATGSINALNNYYKNLKIIWVDAHPDLIDVSKSDYYGYHGYPLAHLTGLSKFPGFGWMGEEVGFANFVYVGIRDIDEDQWINIRKLGIKCFTMDHVDKFGIGEIMKQAIEYLDPKGDAPFHISFDIDGCDPQMATGTGTKFRDGLSHREAIHIIRRVAHERKLVGLDVVEINEKLEDKSKSREKFRGEEEIGFVSPTMGLGVDLVESMFTEYFTI